MASDLADRLFAQNRFPHHRILAGHSAAQSTFHLGAQGQFAHAIGLLGGRDETLLRQGFVLQALEAVAEVTDFGDAGIAAGDASVRRDHRRGAAHGGESLGGSVLDRKLSDGDHRRRVRCDC